jgi:hypothetical protein
MRSKLWRMRATKEQRDVLLRDAGNIEMSYSSSKEDDSNVRKKAMRNAPPLLL